MTISLTGENLQLGHGGIEELGDFTENIDQPLDGPAVERTPTS
jgi:hypothetical protein